MNEAVVDGLFGLVFIAGLGRKAVRYQNQAVLNVIKGDLTLIFIVLILFFQPGVHRRDKGGFHRLLRAAPVLQPAGVVVILDDLGLIGEAEGYRQLYLILGLVLPVPAPALRLPEYGHGQRLLARQLGHIVLDPVLILKIRRLKLAALLVPEPEQHPRIYHGLALHNVFKILCWYSDVGKNLQVGFPADGGARLLSTVGGLHLQSAYIFALLEVQGVLFPVPPYSDVHILAGVLGGAGAQAVQAQGVLVVVPVCVVFSAGIQLAEHKLPVVLAFILVPVHRTSPALVLHLEGAIPKPSDGDQGAVPLPRLVNGVGQDLKDRMLAAVQPIGAKDHSRALSYPVCSLQGGNRFISVICFLLCHKDYLPCCIRSCGPLGRYSSLRAVSLKLSFRGSDRCHCRGNPYLQGLRKRIAAPVCQLARNDKVLILMPLPF